MIKSRNENLKDFAERCKKLKKPYAKYKYMYDYFYKVHSAGASDINALAFILKKHIVKKVKYQSKEFGYKKANSEKIANEFLEDYAFKFKTIHKRQQYVYGIYEYISFLAGYKDAEYKDKEAKMSKKQTILEKIRNFILNLIKCQN